MVGLERLGFVTLISYLYAAIAQIGDHRKASNNTEYTIADGVLSAFSAFFMQCESFLQHQRQMQTLKGRNNATTLFRVERIPSDNQIRNILDGISAAVLFPIFRRVYEALKAGGHLVAYQSFENNLLISLDGTEYFSSQRIHCACCSQRTHKNGTNTYFHNAH